MTLIIAIRFFETQCIGLHKCLGLSDKNAGFAGDVRTLNIVHMHLADRAQNFLTFVSPWRVDVYQILSSLVAVCRSYYWNSCEAPATVQNTIWQFSVTWTALSLSIRIRSCVCTFVCICVRLRLFNPALLTAAIIKINQFVLCEFLWNIDFSNPQSDYNNMLKTCMAFNLEVVVQCVSCAPIFCRRCSVRQLTTLTKPQNQIFGFSGDTLIASCISSRDHWSANVCDSFTQYI